MAKLKRENGEIDEADFAEKEARQRARQFVQEELKRSGDGLHVGCNVYAEDARFLKELLKGESLLADETVETDEALAIPRAMGVMPWVLHPTASRMKQMSPTSQGNAVPHAVFGERPKREWVD